MPTMLRPNFCPACGARLPEGDRYAMPTERSRDCPASSGRNALLAWRGFDVYCPACEWSGDIEPDEKLEEDE